MNADSLKKVYQELSEKKLRDLYAEKETLTTGALSILEEELKQRGILDEIKALANIKSPHYDFESEEELDAFVEARLSEGESLESIRLDLLDHGIDIKKDFQKNFKLEQEIMDYHLNQSVEGKTQAEVYEDIKTKYNVGEEDIQRIKQSQKPTATLYYAAGIFFNCVGALTAAVFLYYVANDEMPLRYIINSAIFFFAAHTSMKKYKILKTDPGETT